MCCTRYLKGWMLYRNDTTQTEDQLIQLIGLNRTINFEMFSFYSTEDFLHLKQRPRGGPRGEKILGIVLAVLVLIASSDLCHAMSTALSLPSIESDVTTSSPDFSSEFSSGKDTTTTTTEALTSSQSPTSLPTATSSEHDLETGASTQLPVTSLESTTHVSHLIPCRTDEEFRRAACLNGGQCFAVDAGEGQRRIVACSCLSAWGGIRCERKEMVVILSTDASWNTATTVVSCLIFAVMVLVLLFAVAISFGLKIPKSKVEYCFVNEYVGEN